MDELIEIRCPYREVSKRNGREYDCHRLAVKVTPGSAGQAWCPACKRAFVFDVTGKSSHQR